MKKLILRFALVCICLNIAIAWTGSGTPGDPYLISDLADLKALSETSSPSTDWAKYYKQTADIDASVTQYWDDDDTNDGTSSGNNEGYSPIGNSTNKFSGTYDGQNYKITGLTINRGGTDFNGMFGYSSGATLISIFLVNVDVTGNSSVGGLYGTNQTSPSDIDDCYVSGSVEATNSTTGACGGLFGSDQVVGSSSIDNCYSTASVTAVGTNVGGFTGYSNGSITNCYSVGAVNAGTAANVGGFIGSLTGTITNCYSSGAVTSSGSNVGGFVGYSDGGTITNSFWDIETSGKSSSAGATGKTSTLMKTESTFTDASWDFATTPIWKINASINSGYPYLAWAESVDSSLPVELTSFTANRKGNAIVLDWVTESEIENLGFIVERSDNGGEWIEIASYKDNSSLQGQGSVTSHIEYSYTDKNITDGIRYDYRLADVSYKGDVEFHYLNSQVGGTTNALLPSDLTVYKNYPNPFNPTTKLSWHLNQADIVIVNIYDAKGCLIKELLNSYHASGYHELLWNGSDQGGTNVSAGVYLVSVRSGNHTQTSKMLLLK